MNKRNPITWLTDLATNQRSRWAVLAFWLVVAGFLGTVAPKLTNLYDNRATSSIGNPESVQADKIISQEFPNQNDIPALIVLSDPHGLSAADTQIATQITCWLLAEQTRATTAACDNLNFPQMRPDYVGSVVSPVTIPQAAGQLISTDQTTMTIIATIHLSNDNSLKIQKTITQIRAYTDTLATANLHVLVTGPGGILADLINIFASTDIKLLLTTVVLVLVLLLVIYRSPLLALLPIVAVGWALVIVTGILGYVAQAHLFPVGQQPVAIMEVLLFGAGTDYVIFIVARLREELRLQDNRHDALRQTMHSVGEAITSSAGTVLLALLSLTLATLGLYSSLGLVLAAAVFVMLLAGLTLVPALLSVLGNIAFWPFIPRRITTQALAGYAAEPDNRGFWGRIAAFVAHRPVVAVIGSVVLLATFSFGTIGVGADFNSLTDLRSTTPSVAGYKLLTKHFPAGTLAPFTIVVHLKKGDVYQSLVPIDAITAAIANVKHVANVIGPTRPNGSLQDVSAAQLQRDFSALPQVIKNAIRSGQPIPTSPSSGGGVTFSPSAIGWYAATVPFTSADSSTALLTITLDVDPYSATALDTMSAIRAATTQTAKAAGLSDDSTSVQLTGVTPQLADTRAASQRDTFLIVPLVLLLVAIVLGLLLRSVIAPLYLLTAVTLNFLGSLGISAVIFTRLQGEEGISYATPLYTFIFLVALGADYTIFLMSRVREEAARRGLHDGVQVALTRTGGVITSAGLILAGTFLVLTTLPLRTLSDFGFAVAIGVLLDTFIVRGFLVPGVVLLLDRANWWPGKLPASPSQ